MDPVGRALGWYRSQEVPPREDLPRYVAPLPDALEEFGLRIAWLVVLVNIAGTVFGFYYYLPQFGMEPVVMWPFVPDSPVATLFIALSLAAWKLGYAERLEPLHALAFFGCLKLGFWTPYTLALFKESFAYVGPLMYNFLFWSHLAMAVQAFLIYRYSEFPVGGVFVAVVWYGFNDLVDYFVPLVGEPHHTILPSEYTDAGISHALAAHDLAAAGAVVLTLGATFLTLSTRVKKLEP